MDGYGPATYGDRWAEHYDDLYGRVDEAVIEFVKARATDGPVLELAPGTGRIALPLRETGLQVDGVGTAEHMLARLRVKPGGREMEIIARDMTDFTTGRAYPLVLLGFITLFAPLEERLQESVFESVPTPSPTRGGSSSTASCPIWADSIVGRLSGSAR